MNPQQLKCVRKFALHWAREEKNFSAFIIICDHNDRQSVVVDWHRIVLFALCCVVDSLGLSGGRVKISPVAHRHTHTHAGRTNKQPVDPGSQVG